MRGAAAAAAAAAAGRRATTGSRVRGRRTQVVPWKEDDGSGRDSGAAKAVGADGAMARVEGGSLQDLAAGGCNERETDPSASTSAGCVMGGRLGAKSPRSFARIV